jgi:predicted RNA-binding Zn-ribbon protein involved in translation (DUF1610 family)
VPIKTSCQSCGKTLSAPDAAAGKKAKCPACGQIMTIPNAAEEDTYAPAPDSPNPYASPAPEVPDRRPCPECGEMIVAGAAKCRFCNAIFDPQLKAGSGSQELKQIANYQRGLIWCILGQILFLIATGIVQRSNPALGLVPGALVWCAAIAGVVFAVLLGMKVYSTAVGVLMGVLAIVPCLGLIMLLIINQAATKRLTESGIKVGFLGADMSQF